jgi:hypothetical protein
MAIATPDEGTLHLGEARAETRSPTRAPGLLSHLRAAWAEYCEENKRHWDAMVEEQARDPSHD